MKSTFSIGFVQYLTVCTPLIKKFSCYLTPPPHQKPWKLSTHETFSTIFANYYKDFSYITPNTYLFPIPI
jgi:hypothetical protein